MQNTHLAAELARRGRLRERNRAARVERGEADRGDDFGLLLSALVGGTERQSRSDLQEGMVREAARSQEKSNVVSPAGSVGRTEVASARRPTPRKPDGKVASAALSSYVRNVSPTEVPQERSKEARSVSVDEPEPPSDAAGQPESDVLQYGRVVPGWVENTSYEESDRAFSFDDAAQTFDEPDTQVESTASHGALRTELLAEVQELVRAAEAQAVEERERRELAKSRARLACYR